MKKILLPLFGLLCPIMMSADYPYMAFLTSDGVSHVVKASGLEMKVSGANLIVSNSASETLQLPLSQLVEMSFSQTASIGGVTFNQDGSVKVYDTTGVCRGTFRNSEAARSVLPAGIYVFTDSEGKSYKTVVAK